MLMLLFSPYLATSLAVDNGAANSQTSSLLPNPHLSRRRSTAELRVVGIETRDIAVPSPLQRSLSQFEQSSHAPCTHARNDHQSLRWPSSFTHVCTRKKGTTAVLLYTAVLRVLEKKGTTAVLLYTAVQ